MLEDTTGLQATYRELTEERLPARATASWPVRDDHCFQRIVLDAVFEDEWYDHVSGRPAYKHLTAEQLRAANDIAREMLADPQRVEELNRESLAYRREH
jgi:hypothetical protein